MKPQLDQQLDAMLNALPREDVPETFAASVLERIDHRRRRASHWRTLAAAMVVAALGASAWLAHNHRVEQASDTREAALRHELRSLRVELRQLEQQRDYAQPVVLLGATDEVDIVVNLRRFAQYQLARSRQLRRSRSPASLTRPAALHTTPLDPHNNARTVPTSGGIYP